MAESRLAFRTRMLDHFWAGLPTIATEGDVLAAMVGSEGAGLVVPANDVDALAHALLRMLTDDDLRRSSAKRAAELADGFRWSKVVEPLVAMAADPFPWRAARATRQRRTGTGTAFGGNGSAGPGAPGELARLAAELAETRAHLAAARRKLDVLNKTPIYPLYKKLQALRSRLRGGGRRPGGRPGPRRPA
jgi:hypothetical protein